MMGNGRWDEVEANNANGFIKYMHVPRYLGNTDGDPLPLLGA
jgi:hypothetical protein